MHNNRRLPFLAAMGMVFLAGVAAQAAGLRIGHAEVNGATNLSAGVIGKIAALRWFFTHASVGGNIITGINVLHAGDAARYPIQIYNYDGDNSDGAYHGAVPTAGSEGAADYRADATPSVTSNGWVYECMRGNPDWSNKLTCFSNSVIQSGWRFPKINVAMDKMCWIDPYADPAAYCAMMNNLEGQSPKTLFVYTTMPLTTETAGSENDLRNTYNRFVRSYCASNNKCLLDVADIQAWTTQGVEQVYGTTNQRMVSAYAVNAGGGDFHLNSTGRRRVALGWYALAGALFQTDRDADGGSDGDELLAGTAPAQSGDVLRVACDPTPAPAGNELVLRWTGATNRQYAVEQRESLTDPANWSCLASNLPYRASGNSYTATAASALGFYRLTARP